jgi:secreted trypsin-like serine protease
MKKSKLFASLAAALAVSAVGVSAGAITNGELDGDRHPQVVLVLMDVDGAPSSRCSGTLIDATHVLTAGHCTSNYPDAGEVTGMRVFTESDVQNGQNDYPYAGPNSVEAVRWAAHPDYEKAPFYFNDVGMIELAEPVVLDAYASLPAIDSLDQLARKRGKTDQTFTAVGYGLQRINPVFIEREKVRMVATPKLLQINTPGFTGDFSLLLSNNHSTGGTCFGDSGGPNFLGKSLVVAGVTSFGMNGTCGGTGGVFRMDRQNVQDFISDFMD